MDCRKFHKNLDDYLEDGLDFPGRFGMERHAQQCISCGKDLSNAQSLRRMTRDLQRVKAPANFETVVLHEIGKRKASSPFSGFRRLWLYFEFPSARRLVLVSSCVAVLAIGIFYVYPRLSYRQDPIVISAPPQVVREPLKEIKQQTVLKQAAATPVSNPKRAAPRKVPELSELKEPVRPPVLKSEQITEQEVTETDYVELQGIGPDNRPVSIRWPNRPPIRYGHDPQQFFIRNISH